MRFKKKTYNFERKEDIIHVFGDFVDYWNEDKMWSVSESIKPRGNFRTFPIFFSFFNLKKKILLKIPLFLGLRNNSR